ncbi:hypothetical protein ROG8370_03794 [Roseovarius gaetbuli]|uniref:Uncharacterized protein n=1 Tax=Roseovarius gaetbuli TaxID=1356575 RepID=A0A1X7ABV8_9RHOB|nr:hypothetical protein ROG8370_03794 [Roseovarius gaetbuli]
MGILRLEATAALMLPARKADDLRAAQTADDISTVEISAGRIAQQYIDPRIRPRKGQCRNMRPIGNHDFIGLGDVAGQSGERQGIEIAHGKATISEGICNFLEVQQGTVGRVLRIEEQSCRSFLCDRQIRLRRACLISQLTQKIDQGRVHQHRRRPRLRRPPWRFSRASQMSAHACGIKLRYFDLRPARHL